MEKRIKVMQVVWRLNTGGAERMVVNFHNNFVNCDDVDIRTLSFTPCKGDLLEEEVKHEGVFYIDNFWGDRLPGPFSKVMRKLFYYKHRNKWFKKQIDEFAPDIIHIHLANMASELYGFCKKLPPSIKVIYHLHSMPEAVSEKYRKNICRGVKEKVYMPVCVTELQKNSAEKIYGISKDTPIVYNGIDQSVFLNCEMSAEEREKLKAELDIPQDAFVVGCVGRIAAIKNYELLAGAAGNIAERKKTVFLVVGHNEADLETEIIKHAQNAKVIFTGPRSDTNRLYKIMDVFALASFFESSSIVTVEAQLSGVPCIISDRISDEVIISDGVAKVSPYAEPDVWAKAIEEAQGKCIKLSDVERFDFNNSVDSLLRLYRKVVE